MKSFRDYHYYRYHQLTKHSVASLHSKSHYLDWENQPYPFRTYQGAKRIDLEQEDKSLSGDFFSPPPSDKNQILSLKKLSSIIYYSLSISAWKKFGDSAWHLRVNPSAGNLHPEEIHLIVYHVEGLAAGIYHYNVFNHSLEKRSDLPLTTDEWDSILLPFQKFSAIESTNSTNADFGVFFIISTIPWRQAWKYEERALRYCFHDTGHTIGSLQYVLEQMKLPSKNFALFNGKKLQNILELSNGKEFPQSIIGIPSKTGDIISKDSERLYLGTPNPLSEREETYSLVEETINLGMNPGEAEGQQPNGLPPDPPTKTMSTTLKPLERIPLEKNPGTEVRDFFVTVRERRSAQAYDNRPEMSLDDLSIILNKAFKEPDSDYHSVGASLVDLYLFAHRISGLERGLFLYDNSADQLLLLQRGNLESTAMSLSLSQEIASDSCVCFVMIANFQSAFQYFGELGYRVAHFEAGRIGQALYIGSESLCYNSTGIGAFFDNEVNKFLQLKEGNEVIYNFAMGKAIPDKRVQTLDGYHHLKNKEPT